MPFKQRRVPLFGDGKEEDFRKKKENKTKEDSSGTGKEEDPKTWGGYCQHGNVLFPFWHRFYCLRLEQALQSVLEKGKERVALHYWDASSKESKSEGLPHIVTTENVYIDGEYVPNPLLKFKLPMAIKDDVSTTDADSQFYEKEAGYETCRYPYSGIRSPDEAKKAAISHNNKIDAMDETAQSLLRANITGWLIKGARDRPGVAQQFEDCLDTTDYNPFSNTTSVHSPDVSVEQPHNDLHVAIGGFTEPKTNEDGSVKLDSSGNISWDGPIEGANGDMGANEVGSYDPVFFLHHSNIDRMLWVWQKKHKKTNPNTFTIDNSDEKDEGTSNSDQGATPNQTWGQRLNENTILYPFQDEYGVPRTTKDCIDIVSQLDYNYSIGSLDQATWPEPDQVNTISLLDKPSTPWKDIRDKLKSEIRNIRARRLGDQGIPASRLRVIFDRTQFTPLHGDHIPINPTGPITIEGMNFKSKSFVQVKDINKDKISGSFLVQVFYRAAGKVYYLGQRGVLSRWNRRNCANCQERKMAHVSIPISGGDSAPYDAQNLQVYLVHKDVMTGEYKREKFTGKDLVVQVAATSAPDKQKPSVRIVEALVQD